MSCLLLQLVTENNNNNNSNSKNNKKNNNNNNRSVTDQPVVDFDIVVSGRVVLEAHELEVKHWREGDEDDTLLCVLKRVGEEQVMMLFPLRCACVS